MKDPHDIIKSLIRTEKGSVLLEQNKYVFEVDTNANKIEIRRAIEAMYKVAVANVNTIIVRGKMRRVRYKMGMTSSWKKAIVTLKPGNKIDIV